MKKYKLFIFTLIVFFGLCIVNVNAETYGAFTYEVNTDGTTAIITGYSNDGPKEVVIPSSIEGKPVTMIKYNAFSSKNLTSLTIPNSVTTIGMSAFMDNQLTSVTIPESVKIIGQFAFLKNKLISITISSTVTAIENMSFSNQKNSEGQPILEKVVVLGKTTAIGEDVFSEAASDNFKIYGYANSTTEEYATTKNYTFVELVELTDSMISKISTQYFTGTALTPVVTVKDGDKILSEGVDYTITYANNDAVGTGKVNITGINKYLGTVSSTFTIEEPIVITPSTEENPNTNDNILLYIYLILILLIGLTYYPLYIKNKYK